MAFINKDGLQHLTNQLVRAENIKVASLRGSNIKEVIDNIQRECDNVAQPNTIQIENNVSIFKAGQGNNVNVSNDIEDGISFFTFKGKTYHNLVKDIERIDKSKSCDVEVVDKAKISFTAKYKDNITGNTSNNRAVIVTNSLKKMLKISTTYTFIYKYTLLNNPYNEDCQLGIAIDMWSQGLGSSDIIRQKGTSKMNITKMNTPSTVDLLSNVTNNINFINLKGRNSEWKIEDFMIFEGDYTQIPIEELPIFVEGIKSSFANNAINIEIKSSNLANIATDNYLEPNKGNFDIANIEPGEYTLSLKRNDTSIKYNIKLFVNGEYKDIENAQRLNVDCVSFKVEEKGILRMNAYTNNIDISEIMLVKGVFNQLSMPGFVPYNIQVKTIDIKEPLRSLPNGTCDEIKNDNEATKLIRKITKINLNGSENWQILNYPPSQSNTHIQFSCVIQHLVFKQEVWQNNTLFLCDKLPCANDSLHWNGLGENGIGGDGSQIIITWKKTSAPFNDLSSFKLWLQQNNITLFLPLKEDKITQIESLQSVISQGATINLNSDIAPYSTHTVVLNRSGQIEQGVELIAKLRSKIDDLEREYDNNLLNTQLKINDLKLNLKLKGDK